MPDFKVSPTVNGTKVTETEVAAVSESTPLGATDKILTIVGSALRWISGTNLLASLKTYFDTLYSPIATSGTWLPEITGSTSDPTVTFTVQAGKWREINGIRFISFDITINTYSGGSGQLRISLPSPVAAGSPNGARMAVSISNVDTPNSAVNVIFQGSPGNSYGLLISAHDVGAATAFTTAALSAGDIINASGWYFVN